MALATGRGTRHAIPSQSMRERLAADESGHLSKTLGRRGGRWGGHWTHIEPIEERANAGRVAGKILGSSHGGLTGPLATRWWRARGSKGRAGALLLAVSGRTWNVPAKDQPRGLFQPGGTGVRVGDAAAARAGERHSPLDETASPRNDAHRSLCPPAGSATPSDPSLPRTRRPEGRTAPTTIVVAAPGPGQLYTYPGRCYRR